MTTHGAQGVRVRRRGRPEVRVAAVAPRTLADPTGVGDAFRSGYLAGIEWGVGDERAAQGGCMLATLVLETVGTQEHDTNPRTLLDRFAEAYSGDAAAAIAPHLLAERMRTLACTPAHALTAAEPRTARLLVTCADRPGIVAAVSGFLYRQGANVVQSDQYSTDAGAGRFFMRVVFSHPDLDNRLDLLQQRFAYDVADAFDMWFQLRSADARPRLRGLRLAPGPLPARAAVALAARGAAGPRSASSCPINANLRKAVEVFGVPFEHMRPCNRAVRPRRSSASSNWSRDASTCLVLARYMQVLSGEMLRGPRHARGQHSPTCSCPPSLERGRTSRPNAGA